MNIGNQFPTDKDKQEAIEQMRALEQSHFWMFLKERIITPAVKEIEEQIFNTEGESEQKAKLERKYLLKLLDFPQSVIQSLSVGGEVFDDDPYIKKISKPAKAKR